MSPNLVGSHLSVQSGAIRDATTQKLRRVMRQRDHVLAKVVRMQRQVAEMPSIGRAKCSVLARMSSIHYDEFTQLHSTVVGLVESENELEEQEKIYIGFENLYVDLNVTLEELTITFSQEQKGKEEELKQKENDRLEKHDQDGQDKKQLQQQDKETTTGDVAMTKHSSDSANDQDGQVQKQLQEEQNKETTTEDAALIKRKAIMVIKYLMLMWGHPTVEELLLSSAYVNTHQLYEQQFIDVWDKLTTTAPSVRKDLLQMHRMALHDFFRKLEPIKPSEDEKRNNLCQMINGSYPHIVSLILLGAKITDEAEQLIISMMVTAMPLWLQELWNLKLKAIQRKNETEIATLQHMFDFVQTYCKLDSRGCYINKGPTLNNPSLTIPDVNKIN